jgi:hypothetical protein
MAGVFRRRKLPFRNVTNSKMLIAPASPSSAIAPVPTNFAPQETLRPAVLSAVKMMPNCVPGVGAEPLKVASAMVVVARSRRTSWKNPFSSCRVRELPLPRK